MEIFAIPIRIALQLPLWRLSCTQRTEEETQGKCHPEPPPPSSLPHPTPISLFIYCLQFFHRTHIDAEKAGCECVSESFPDEGDKVEVISRALMQYDSSRTAGTQLRAAERRRRRRRRKNPHPLKEAARWARATLWRKVDLFFFF